MGRWKEGKKRGRKEMISPFIHSFKKHLLSTCCMLSFVPGVENMDIK